MFALSRPFHPAAFLFVAGSLGPLLGYAISGFSLSRHADFYKGPVYAQAGDPNWLGAWWLCYAINGATLVIVGVPIMLFPKKMRRRAKITKDDTEMEMTSHKRAKQAVKDSNEDADTAVVKTTDQGKCAHALGNFNLIPSV